MTLWIITPDSKHDFDTDIQIITPSRAPSSERASGPAKPKVFHFEHNGTGEPRILNDEPKKHEPKRYSRFGEAAADYTVEFASYRRQDFVNTRQRDQIADDIFERFESYR